VFGYGTVPLTYNFKESMREPTRVVGATVLALTGVAASYMIAGVGLYALFPTLTADVLHELPSKGVLPSLTRWSLCGVILTTAPLLIVPVCEMIEGKLGAASRRQRALVRFAGVSCCVGVAVLLPNFVEALAFVGSFCVATVSFCLPPVLRLQLSHKNLQHRSLLDIIMLVAGILATCTATICTLTQ
jgi:amino acid permease